MWHSVSYQSIAGAITLHMNYNFLANFLNITQTKIEKEKAFYVFLCKLLNLSYICSFNSKLALDFMYFGLALYVDIHKYSRLLANILIGKGPTPH